MVGRGSGGGDLVYIGGLSWLLSRTWTALHTANCYYYSC